MSTPPVFAMYVASGSAGTPNPQLTSSRGTEFVAGQQLWHSFFYRATRTTGTGLLTLQVKVRWWNAALTELTAASQDLVIDATIAATFHELQVVAPATATTCALDYTLIPATATMQHDFYLWTPRLGRTQVAADITSSIEGPVESTVFKHSHLGVAESGQFPRDLTFKLYVSGIVATTGVTWTYEVLTGTVNTFTAASGVKSMTGTGTGTLTVSSMGSNTAAVEVTATAGGVARTKIIEMAKGFAAAPVGGGSTTLVSQNSGFTAINTTTFAAVTGTLTGAVPTATTAVNINVNLSFTPGPPYIYSNSWTVEAKVQRNVSGTWTDKGTVRTADSVIDDGVVTQDATFAFTVNDTGLTASTSYDWRVVARLQSGTRTHDVTGTVTVTT